MLLVNSSIVNNPGSEWVEIQVQQGDDFAAMYPGLTNSSTGVGTVGGTISVETSPAPPVGIYSIKHTYTGNGTASGFSTYYIGTDVGGYEYMIEFYMMSTSASINAGTTAWSNWSSIGASPPVSDYLSASEKTNQTWVYRRFGSKSNPLINLNANDPTVRVYSCPNNSGINGSDNSYVSGLRIWELYDSIKKLSPIIYLKGSGIDPSVTVDGNAISTWYDVSRTGTHLTPTTNGTPALNIGTNSDRQVDFDGSTDYFSFTDDARLDFTPGTNEFSIVVREGDTKSTIGYWIAKADNATTGRQYTLDINNNTLLAVVGGTAHTVTTVTSTNANRLVIMTVSTNTSTGLNVWVDGVLEINSQGFGTTTATSVLNVGGRTNGSALINGDLSLVAIFDKVLTTEEREAIQREFQIN